jgi:hypothetical protein
MSSPPQLDSPFVVTTRSSDGRRSKDQVSWSEAVSHVTEWVTLLKAELEAPDLWRALEDASFAEDGSGDNSPFSDEERQEIARNVAAIKGEHSASGSLNPTQLRHLESKLDYLVDAAGRMGRLDWRNLVAGTMLGMLSEAILPSETTHRVFSTLLHSVSQVLGHSVPLLPSP